MLLGYVQYLQEWTRIASMVASWDSRLGLGPTSGGLPTATAAASAGGPASSAAGLRLGRHTGRSNEQETHKGLKRKRTLHENHLKKICENTLRMRNIFR